MDKKILIIIFIIILICISSIAGLFVFLSTMKKPEPEKPVICYNSEFESGIHWNDCKSQKGEAWCNNNCYVNDLYIVSNLVYNNCDGKPADGAYNPSCYNINSTDTCNISKKSYKTMKDCTDDVKNTVKWCVQNCTDTLNNKYLLLGDNPTYKN
jgi:hypothetical protein